MTLSIRPPDLAIYNQRKFKTSPQAQGQTSYKRIGAEIE